jgi:hypothetical protein
MNDTSAASTKRTGRRLISRALGWLAAGLALWTLAIGAFGGVTFQVGGRTISSNDPTNPAMFVVVLVGIAWALAAPADRQRVRHRLAGWGESGPAVLGPAVAGVAALAVTMVGITQGSRAVGGADAYGYVSQADLWARGQMRYEEPLLREFADWPFAPRAFAPLGYLTADDGRTMVPAYAPGFPLVLAAFQRAAGPAAVFWVVPLLAGLAVCATYAFGAALAGRLAGASAAVILATSPVFLFQTLIAPMSDVPATAWWAAALACAFSRWRAAPWLSGVAAGLAILTRPNLAPLALCPALMIVWSESPAHDRSSWLRRGLLFAAGIVPGVAAAALINANLYGSPLLSGQLIVNPGFSLANVPGNASNYFDWLMYTQTPFVLVALAAPWVMTGRNKGSIWTTVAFIALVWSAYLAFMPVDAWFWLRYLLPSFPALFVLMGGALAALLSRAGKGVGAGATVLAVSVLAAHGLSVARGEQVAMMAPGEAKYEMAGRFAAEELPARSIFLAMVYSGSIRYYANRPIVRYDAIPRADVDRAISDLQARGYHPYLVVEDSEVPLLQRWFGPAVTATLLSRPVVKDFGHSSGVRVLDLAPGR